MLGLEDKIGYHFKDKALLTKALTHSSYANEMRLHGGSYERLEFLGDSVLSLIVSDYLFKNFSDLPEGDLTKIRAAIVCEQSLFTYAQKLGLGEYLLLGKGEQQNGGRQRPSLLADAFEALLAAMYLDGGFEVVQKMVLSFVNSEIKHIMESFHDYKTQLQEIIQQNPEERLEYVLVAESGPDHNKRFTVHVMLNSNVIGVGEGRSKKQAEQMAAKQALELMGQPV
ncbi:MAG TPA: ribonuclease III [Clostridiales bacterium]|nr:ribonuclease III [Clostridiales bacterium]